MQVIVIYLIGLVFGVGISISGMASPAKVLNFFDFAGTWDPSLILVMGGALVVTFIGYRVVFGWNRPVFAQTFQVPTRRDIDLPLIGGSALFGLGWGISGFCPGGALPALGTGRVEVFIFIAAMIAGILAARGLQTLTGRRAAAVRN
ncbi:hypothetical protein DEA8626_03930 [Defluviimonas aquaemixtae]|uniref:Sulphur transport domain-containing protein n=1 Tax=Albidovulum aquaemixtae TaxID=1542388 RepID=A0A2R8BN76_9RHOB|nr:DUF6691 family protein [Defluviimonas aquaemixtae]SPH24896.1 hypothetical protein DEA8626_03930 [Defluviimonas aquaemixtae]